MYANDPVPEYQRLGELRDARFDGVLDPDLVAELIITSHELVAVMRRGIERIRTLPAGDPAKSARRRAEIAWIEEVIRGMVGVTH
jgi:hypothetical protein